MGTVDASVVIVSHNEGANLRRTVDCLLRTSKGCVEMIVVDDLSTDGSERFLTEREYTNVIVVRPQSRAGVAGARNLGARTAKGEVLVFSDAHVDPQEGWLEPLVAALDDEAVGAVAPAISVMGNEAQKGYGFTWTDPSLKMVWLNERPSTRTEVPFLCGCFLATRKAMFEYSGRFDSGLVKWGFEDAEFSLRLWLSGYSCVVEPAAEIAHLFRPSFPYQVQWDTTIHNQIRTAFLHFSPDRLLRVIRHARTQPQFGDAYMRIIESDLWNRRLFVRDIRRRTDEWFFDRFAIRALTDD